MIEKVNSITNDPLKAVNDEEEKILLQEMEQREKGRGQGREGREGLLET